MNVLLLDCTDTFSEFELKVRVLQKGGKRKTANNTFLPSVEPTLHTLAHTKKVLFEKVSEKCVRTKIRSSSQLAHTRKVLFEKVSEKFVRTKIRSSSQITHTKKVFFEKVSQKCVRTKIRSSSQLTPHKESLFEKVCWKGFQD